MTPSGRKQKGKTYETKIAEMIHSFLMEFNEEYKTLYESLGNENLKPQRDFASGNFKGSDGDIDLGLAKKFFPYSLEMKHHKDLDLSLNAILTGKISKLKGIWEEQVMPKVIETGLNPMIVFRANRTEDFCFIKTNHVKDLNKFNFHVRIDDFAIVRFKDFLDYVKMINFSIPYTPVVKKNKKIKW